MLPSSLGKMTRHHPRHLKVQLLPKSFFPIPSLGLLTVFNLILPCEPNIHVPVWTQEILAPTSSAYSQWEG